MLDDEVLLCVGARNSSCGSLLHLFAEGDSDHYIAQAGKDSHTNTRFAYKKVTSRPLKKVPTV